MLWKKGYKVENLEFERPQKTHILFRKLNSSRNQEIRSYVTISRP
jgi:hypothetical protein